MFITLIMQDPAGITKPSAGSIYPRSGQ